MQSNSSSATIRVKQIWDIPGGIHPPENKEQSLKTPILQASLPEQVVLPLSMHIGAPAEPIVKVGDKVLTGQMIAEPVGFVSTAIHASISGTVVAIEDRPIPHSSGLSAPTIVIQSDGQDQWTELHPIEDYRNYSAESLVEILKSAGLAGMGGASFPTSVKLHPKKPIHTLILNGTECEPYITADHALMRERAEDIVKGAQLLAYLLGEPEQILIGIEDNKPDAVKLVRAAAKSTNDQRIQVIDFPTKYPSGGEKQLIQILTGKEVASGGLPSDLGIVLQNIATAVAALEAIVQGKPLISRVTTLVGEALNTQQNMEVRIGTLVSSLLDINGYDDSKADRVVMGGPMMGFSLLNLDVPVTKITNCLLVPTKTELPPPPPAQACIRCGHCAEACPVSLLPQQLFWHAQSYDEEKLKDHNLFDCIECGACAYVCPSSIPLVQYYRAAKGEIRKADKEKIKSDQARVRFEARQERLAKEAVEREAKRKARMEAAKAKQAAKEAAAAESNAPKDDATDLIAQAMARVNKAKTSPEDELAKLDRQRQTFEGRLADIQDKIESVDTDELKAKFSAQLKNTEKKLLAVQQKIADLTTNLSETLETQKSSKPDPAAEAIERAKQKVVSIASVSDTDKLTLSLESLIKRKEKAEAKLLEARENGSDTVDALQHGLTKIEEKIAVTKTELSALNGGDINA